MKLSQTKASRPKLKFVKIELFDRLDFSNVQITHGASKLGCFLGIEELVNE